MYFVACLKRTLTSVQNCWVGIHCRYCYQPWVDEGALYKLLWQKCLAVLLSVLFIFLWHVSVEVIKEKRVLLSILVGEAVLYELL